MALRVEVAGYGVCQTNAPYAVFVVCVQQENWEPWTVYRRYNGFQLLRDQLIHLHTTISSLPVFNPENLQLEYLESCRETLDRWLQGIASNNNVLRTQSMYQFLCIDANMPPPYVEVHWRDSGNESCEEMDMDDMFNKDSEDPDMPEDFDEDEQQWEGDDSAQRQQSPLQPPTVFNAPNRVSGSNRVNMRQSASTNDAIDEDALEIQSLSVVEAEFIYNKVDEGSVAMTHGDSAAKRTINLEAFKIIRVIGKGSFGKVFLVRDKSNGTLYAMKVLKKDYIIKKNQVEHTKTERSVLSYIHHPFVVGLNMAFQTVDKLFLVLDYCPGGELFFHLGKVGRFPEERSKFYAAQITLALEYVHKMDVIYRDLKPENVLLDQHGNVRLTDFGLSKEGVSDHSTGANSFCGTPEYIAPEVLRREGHGRAVDWWSLGALLYEMIIGLPPFYSRNRETMFEKIMRAELNFPPQISNNAKDLLSRLLVVNPKLRLGSGDSDASEIKEHPFFVGTDWVALEAGRITPPWTPLVAGSLDTSQFDQEFTSMMPIVSPDVRGAYFGSLDRAFEGFTYVGSGGSRLMAQQVSARK